MAHSHKFNDRHIVESQGELFCILCADYCSIIPNYILPPWFRNKGGPQIEKKYGNANYEKQ